MLKSLFLMGALLLPLATAHAEQVVGEISYLTTSYEDTLQDIATKHDFGFVELVTANPDVDPWLPGEGVNILMPGRHILPKGKRQGILVNVGEMRLYYFNGNGQIINYPIAVGREGKFTPIGETTVRSKKVDPIWYPTASTRKDKPELPAMVPAGPDNPLGKHALYLGWNSYLIHGTNKPDGIGRNASRGCIRMYPDDVEKLFHTVPIGTHVQVVNQPVKIALIEGEVYVEAHPTQQQADEIELHDHFITKQPVEPEIFHEIVQVAGDKASNINWKTLRKVLQERRGYPIMVTGNNNS